MIWDKSAAGEMEVGAVVEIGPASSVVLLGRAGEGGTGETEEMSIQEFAGFHQLDHHGIETLRRAHAHCRGLHGDQVGANEMQRPRHLSAAMRGRRRMRLEAPPRARQQVMKFGHNDCSKRRSRRN